MRSQLRTQGELRHPWRARARQRSRMVTPCSVVPHRASALTLTYEEDRCFRIPPGKILVHSSTDGPRGERNPAGDRADRRRRPGDLGDPLALAPGLGERDLDRAGARHSRGRRPGARALSRPRARRERREHRDGAAARRGRALRDAPALARRPARRPRGALHPRGDRPRAGRHRRAHRDRHHAGRRRAGTSRVPSAVARARRVPDADGLDGAARGATADARGGHGGFRRHHLGDRRVHDGGRQHQGPDAHADDRDGAGDRQGKLRRRHRALAPAPGAHLPRQLGADDDPAAPRAGMSGDALVALGLSIRVALFATLLNALLGIPLAYILARRAFRGRALVDLLVTLPLVLPPTVTGYYLIVLLGRRGWLGAPVYAWTGWSVAFTWYAAVIAATVMALPLLVRTARAAIESVDRELEKAAYTLGRSEWRTALEVTLPLAKNGIIAGLVLAFARALGEFGATLMLAGNIPGKTTTVPLAIYTAVQTGEMGEAVLLVMALTILSCFVLMVAGRLGARAA